MTELQSRWLSLIHNQEELNTMARHYLTRLCGPLAMFGDDAHKGGAIGGQLLGADTGNGGHGLFIQGALDEHFPQRAVMEDDIGWHLLLARQAQAQRAQVFPQWLVLKLDRRRVALRLDALAPLTAIAAIAAQMQALLAAQQGAAGLAQAQAAMTGHIDLGVAKRDQLAQDGAPFLLAQLVGA